MGTTRGGDLGLEGVLWTGGGTAARLDGVGDLDPDSVMLPSLAGLAGTAMGLTGAGLSPLPFEPGVVAASRSSLLMMESMLKLLDLAAGLGGDAATGGCCTAGRGWRWLKGEAEEALAGDWALILRAAAAARW